MRRMVAAHEPTDCGLGRWWSTLPDGRILCELCPRACKLGEGQRAFCFVRQNDGGRMRLPHFGVEFEVMEIPGHTRTHIAFYGGGMLFCGDTLFAVGCGRLFEGTPRQMHDSLSKLMRLPDDTRIYCGHEYTLSNIRFARAADPGNKTLLELEAKAGKLRDRDLPTLPSTIAQEKATNPFVRCGEPAVIASANRYTGKTLNDPVSVLAAIREWKNNF